MKNKAVASGIISLSLLSLVFAVFLSFSSKQSTSSIIKAEGNDCDLCINEPPCCAEIINTHDAFSCEWPTRGWCQPSTCSQIEGKGQKCGWYWVFHDANDNDYKLGTNGVNGYGCMIGATEQTMRPRCGPQASIVPTIQPTIPPQPTSPPQSTQAPEPTTAFQPTSQPPPNNPFPTQIQVFPTNTMFMPTLPPSQSPSFPSFSFPNLPKIIFPAIKLNFDRQKIKEEAAKPLGFFEYLFERITYYDRLLEQTINDKFKKL
jgi:hypothetical protein